ncbi:phospho-sugar mutase [Pseudonocardia sp. N23]|uniref:phospho-sugar mutase n=1 Tax=Pseudonocardia sp. N23 TaxID=1987376 RepID=UPI000BFD8EA1|nr:phospho-sugar mutase [Pseudonocardia sp. N23]
MRWIADDPDPATRASLQQLVASAMAGVPGADDELADLMRSPLRFGTAGLRGPVRAGPAGMNVAVVVRTTAALAEWLRRNGHGGGTVVVGRDARHGSVAFAAAVAGVLGAAGFDAVALPGASPTPLLAFAVRHLGAVAGVQVTASHNPASDNGYKVYLGDGAQLVPPVDTQIEELAAAAGAAVAIRADGPVRSADPLPEYLERVAALPRGAARGLRIALTPLHGVGGAAAVQALALAGFTDVHVVAAQAVPDPDFPTVGSPNPEHPGTTDALLALAADVDADLAVALDPDADRCALGVAEPAGWRMLSGDETGAVLGEHLLRTGRHPDPLVATTVVSSSMLRAVASARGARFAETLTGFKWIVRAGAGLVYGYEEALGYCVDPDAVRDKDGIATTVVAADLAATLRATGSSLPARLDELAATYGVHATAQVTVPFTGGGLPAVFSTPPGGWDVERPAPDVLVLRRGAARVVVRPSGTEPILKTYLEVVEEPGPDVTAARARASAQLEALATETREWR